MWKTLLKTFKIKNIKLSVKNVTKKLPFWYENTVIKLKYACSERERERESERERETGKEGGRKKGRLRKREKERDRERHRERQRDRERRENNKPVKLCKIHRKAPMIKFFLQVFL